MEHFIASLSQLQEKFFYHAEMVRGQYREINERLGKVEAGLAKTQAGLTQTQAGLTQTQVALTETRDALVQTTQSVAQLAATQGDQATIIDQLFNLTRTSLDIARHAQEQVSSLEERVNKRFDALEKRLPPEAA